MMLQLAVETFKKPITISCESGKIILSLNGRTWMGETLDQCITDMKQTFAIQYLENFEPIKE